MLEDVQEHSVGVIPVKKSPQGWQVFLIHQIHGNFWGFPKGHVEPEETPIDTAKRELFEETGYQISKLLKENPWTEFYTFTKQSKMVRKKVEYFLVEVTGDFSLQVEEIHDGKWFTFDEAMQKVTYPSAKNILNKTVTYLSSKE
jgi:bis(5'-nucleosidyl)-tetraphosphatase